MTKRNRSTRVHHVREVHSITMSRTDCGHLTGAVPTTTDPDKVTCSNCLRAMKADNHAAVASRLQLDAPQAPSLERVNGSSEADKAMDQPHHGH